MRKRKVAVTFYLDAEQQTALASLREQTRVPAAVHLRAALGEYLERHAPKKDTTSASVTDSTGTPVISA